MGRRSLALCAAALLASTPLTSCFTTALWNDGGDGHSLSLYSARDDDQGLGILEKLALTPFTLLLDLVTMPVQSLFSDDEGDWSVSSHHDECPRSPTPPSPSRPNPRTDGLAATPASGGETPALQPRRD